MDGGVKQAGGRQLLRGGIGGAAGSPSSPAVGGGSGGVMGTGGERKMCRFMGTGRGAGRGTGAGGARARSRPARIRRRWPGRCMPMSNRLVSLRPWHSAAHISPCFSKSAVYCSRCSARSHSATDREASLLSAMASASRGPGPGSDLPPSTLGPPERLFLFPGAPHGAKSPAAAHRGSVRQAERLPTLRLAGWRRKDTVRVTGRRELNVQGPGLMQKRPKYTGDETV